MAVRFRDSVSLLESHEPVLVLDLSKHPGFVRVGLNERFAGKRAVEYHALVEPESDGVGLQPGERYHRFVDRKGAVETLASFGQLPDGSRVVTHPLSGADYVFRHFPGKSFPKRLQKALGPLRFDEIHLHMDGGQKDSDDHPAVLKGVAERLKEGGRLVTSWVDNQPIVPKRPPIHPNDVRFLDDRNPASDVEKQNGALARYLRLNGLRLDEVYAFNPANTTRILVPDFVRGSTSIAPFVTVAFTAHKPYRCRDCGELRDAPINHKHA